MKFRILSIILIYLLLISCNQKIDKKIDETNSAVEKLSSRIDDLQSQNNEPRFKIVQSTIAALGTYKLDSYNGDVYQMVVDAKGNNKWNLIRKIVHSYNDTKVEGKVNYEIFLSTIAMRFTYLINVNTGVSWQLFQDPDTEENFFSPIE